MACVMPQVTTHSLLPTASQGLPEAAFQVAYVQDMAAAPIEGTMGRHDDRLQYTVQRRRLDTPKGHGTLLRAYHVRFESRERAYLADKSETDLITVVVRWPRRNVQIENPCHGSDTYRWRTPHQSIPANVHPCQGSTSPYHLYGGVE
jgi:hypothetical protein